MEHFVSDISHAYRDLIIDQGKQPELLTLLAFLLTFGFIRTSAHLIRRGVKWWPGNVETKGGLHIHHLVWGICLLILIGYIAIALEPPSPWHEVLGILFGVGMGLTLDEFALWLHLDDVYWTEKGRQSIDAVIVAAGLFGMMLLGIKFWVDLGQEVILRLTGLGDQTGEKGLNSAILSLVQLAGLACAVISFLKQKIMTAVVGFFVPLIAIIGAARVAKPNSRWAKWRYGPQEMEKAHDRFPQEKKI